MTSKAAIKNCTDMRYRMSNRIIEHIKELERVVPEHELHTLVGFPVLKIDTGNTLGMPMAELTKRQYLSAIKESAIKMFNSTGTPLSVVPNRSIYVGDVLVRTYPVQEQRVIIEVNIKRVPKAKLECSL